MDHLFIEHKVKQLRTTRTNFDSVTYDFSEKLYTE